MCIFSFWFCFFYGSHHYNIAPSLELNLMSRSAQFKPVFDYEAEKGSKGLKTGGLESIRKEFTQWCNTQRRVFHYYALAMQ